MKTLIRIAVGATALAAVAAAHGASPKADGLRLDRIVMLMRHGVRPPTSAQPAPVAYSPDPWPRWGVDYGLLTEHGAAGAALLGEADRSYLVRAGLLPEAGCPADGTISVDASNKERAIRTAEEWSRTLVPGCAVAIATPGDGGEDMIFHPLEGKPTAFDGRRAYRESLALAPAAGIEEVERTHAGEIALLGKVLGCAAPACDLRRLPSQLKEQLHDRPHLTGVLDVGSSASQSLLLEYLEGMPMASVGWGRVSRAEIERLLVFHPIAFRFESGAPSAARAAAGPLARRMSAVLDGSGDKDRITLLAGHDTNIADLGALFDLHWHVPSYPADDVPPGSAIGFELWRDARGSGFVRAFYRAQTMDQLRSLARIDGARGPYRAYLDIPGCGTAHVVRTCTLARFDALVAEKLKVPLPTPRLDRPVVRSKAGVVPG